MTTAYYHILEKLKEHFTSDVITNSITQGSIADVDLSKQTIFPLAHLMINGAVFDARLITFNVSVIMMDIVDISKAEVTDVFIGNDNEQDVLNTQLAVSSRLYESLIRGDLFDQKIQVIGSANNEPFVERFENLLAGWTLTFDVQLPRDMTIC